MTVTVLVYITLSVGVAVLLPLWLVAGVAWCAYRRWVQDRAGMFLDEVEAPLIVPPLPSQVVPPQSRRSRRRRAARETHAGETRVQFPAEPEWEM